MTGDQLSQSSLQPVLVEATRQSGLAAIFRWIRAADEPQAFRKEGMPLRLLGAHPCSICLARSGMQ